MASLLSFSILKASAPRASVSTIPAVTAPDQTNLEQQFGRKGIKFSDSGTVELTVRNGSSLKLHIPSGHVSSYKPKVYWKDDGFEEVLYSIGTRGGIGLVLDEIAEPGTPSKNKAFSEWNWSVRDTDSDSLDALQVEMGCTRGNLEVTYVVSLYPLCMATAVIVKNNSSKPVNITSAILSHFKFKKRSRSGIQGLSGCSYCVHPPPSFSFGFLSPSEALKPEDPGLFSFGWKPEKKPGEWSVQDDAITILRHKLSRLYASPPEERSKEFHRTTPSKFETLDQGRELFFRVIRMGFEEIFLSTPGSYAEQYGKEYFICTGPAALLVPISLNPGEEWRGAQVIEHDNL